MNDILKDKLTKAIEEDKRKKEQIAAEKENDPNTFTWKGERSYVGDKVVQSEMPMMNGTEEQLNKWYAFCNSMLYSTDKKDPGRYVLLQQIKDQRHRCNAVLYMMYLRNPNHPDGHSPYPTHRYFNDLREFLNKPDTLEVAPRSQWGSTPISQVAKVPADFADIPISIVLDAAMDNLGVMNMKHITTNFLAKMGLWFTKDEIKWFLTQKDENGNSVDRLEMVRQNLNLRPDVKLHVNPKGGLSYTEFSRLHKMNDCKYSEIPEDTLKLLRNKVLFQLEETALNHAKFWKKKKEQIEKVCELKGYHLGA